MNDRTEQQTFYEILEVKPTASPSEIYAAYQRARQTYSPTSPALYSMFTPQEAQELLSLIEQAYRTLSHQARRKEYDSKIGVAPAPTPEMKVIEQKPATPGSENWVGSVKVAARKEELPEGFARTKFSVYEINPDIEAEIRSMETCNGKFLQKVRLYKGVTLDHISDEIRVIKSTLVALEADDVDALPVAVFTRGFVVQFARALGLDERRVADAYMKFFRAQKSGSP